MKAVGMIPACPVMLCYGLHPDIIQSILDYDYMIGVPAPRIAGIIAGNRKQERFYWGESEIALPVYAGVSLLPEKTRRSVTLAVNFSSGRRVLSGSEELLENLPALRYYSVFAEGVPEAHALQVARMCRQKKIMAIGSASVGMVVPGLLKLGAIGGISPLQITQANIIGRGDVAVISTSGGMVNELINTVTQLGYGVSVALSLGGEQYPFTTPAEAVRWAQQDDATKTIVYFGELGGTDEYEIANLLRQGKVTKTVIAYVAGDVAELFGEAVQFGHAKAMARTQSETAAAKKRELSAAGAVVLQSLSGLAKALKVSSSAACAPQPPVQAIGSRRKRLLVSHISGESQGETQVLGANLVTIVQESSFAQLVVQMLLGRTVSSERLIGFTDLTLRLLVDHGPYVSGAVNTIVAARAGKDYVSSLAAGLLTIGPRFGGAINEAAKCWLDGVAAGISAKDFTEQYVAAKNIIPGIGHKRYSTNRPDPRLRLLTDFAGTDTTYLDFARSVERITTTKKRNLILNVDGTIAAILLDLLHAELGYTHDDLKELVEAEFFNALFVISRTVGFSAHYVDQRRYDEGLLRLSEDDVLYIPRPES